MVTYLVVLLQFQISIPDDNQGEMELDGRSFLNDTTTTTTVESSSVATTMTTILTTLAKKINNKQ